MSSLKVPVLHFAVNYSIIIPSNSSKIAYPVSSSPGFRQSHRLVVRCARSAISRIEQGSFDPELRSVLELATESELLELESILFGPSYFSPLLKSVTNGANVDRSAIDIDLQERDNYITALESRFLFLAADARSTLRGWRPSYRNVLLAVRKELSIPCSSKLLTEDLEVEIFLHLLQDYSSEGSGASTAILELHKPSSTQASLELGLNKWKVQAESASKDFRSMILKGGGMFTLANIYRLLSKKLFGKVFREAANYQIKKEFIKKGGQLAAINLESRAALLAAKQVFAGAASRYAGFRSAMALLGPMKGALPKYIQEDDVLIKNRLWGTFLADLVIQMLGTDYARILRAIYAFAQIRVTRTFKFPSQK